MLYKIMLSGCVQVEASSEEQAREAITLAVRAAPPRLLGTPMTETKVESIVKGDDVVIFPHSVTLGSKLH